MTHTVCRRDTNDLLSGTRNTYRLSRELVVPSARVKYLEQIIEEMVLGNIRVDAQNVSAYPRTVVEQQLDDLALVLPERRRIHFSAG